MKRASKGLFTAAGATAFPLVTLSGVSHASIIYQDSFTRSGVINGSQPDVVDTNANTWSDNFDTGSGNGNSAITLNGSAAVLPQTGPFNDQVVTLPVNGASGVTVDGTQNFTISADVINLTGENRQVGIILGPDYSPSAVGDFFVGPGTSAGLQLATKQTIIGTSSPIDATSTLNLELLYNASTQQITADVNGTPWTSTSGASFIQVTASEVAGLAQIGIFSANNPGGYGGGATIDNFVFAEGSVPEPGSATLLITTAAGLLLRRGRRTH